MQLLWLSNLDRNIKLDLVILICLFIVELVCLCVMGRLRGVGRRILVASVNRSLVLSVFYRDGYVFFVIETFIVIAA